MQCLKSYKNSSSSRFLRDRYRDRDTDEESEKGHRSRRRRERDQEPRGEDYEADRSHRSHNRSSRSVTIQPPQALTTDDERDEVKYISFCLKTRAPCEEIANFQQGTKAMTRGYGGNCLSCLREVSGLSICGTEPLVSTRSCDQYALTAFWRKGSEPPNS